MRPTRGQRVGSLDGLRAVALLAVLAYHAAPGLAKGGFLGVDVFFVLSGYLLMSLLVAEQQSSGRIDVRAYAERRVSRIAPGLFALLIAVAVFAPILARDDAHRVAGDVGWSFAGLTNWHLIAERASYFVQLGRPSFVRHLWSVSVELQCYVLLALVAVWAVKRTRAVAILTLAFGVAWSAAFMGVLYKSPDAVRAYYGTDARAGAVLSGALLAIVLAYRADVRLSRRTGAAIGTAGAAVLGVLFFLAPEGSRALYPAGFIATQAASVALIAGAAGVPLLTARPLRWLGRRSYGIYLWHWPLVVLLRPGIDVSWHPAVAASVALLGAVTAGSLSYRYVELPFMRGRHRSLEPRWRAVGAASFGIATVALLAIVSRAAIVDPVAESIAAGERVLAHQDTVPLLPEASAAVADVSSTRVPEARPVAQGSVPRQHFALSPIEPGSVRITAIGDSVMLGSAVALKARLGSTAYIDAVKSRHFGQGVLVVKQLREQHRLGDVLVVHLGNNGYVSRDEVDWLMREAKGPSHVLLLTVRVNRSWQDPVNATLRDGARRYPIIRIVDWYAFSAGHRDWFFSDGTHMNSTGAISYAQLVAGSIPPAPTPEPAKTPKPKKAKQPKPKATPTPGPLPTVPPVGPFK